MLLSSSFVAILFRLINFIALILFFRYIYKKNNVGQSIAEGIAQEEAAVKALEAQTHDLAQQRHALAQNIEQQKELGERLKKQIARWKEDVERVRAQEAEAWAYQQQFIQKIVQRRSDCLAKYRAQQAALPEVVHAVTQTLENKFQDAQAGKQYIADIIESIQRGAA